MHKRMLHVEVLRVMEDCNSISIALFGLRGLFCLLLLFSCYRVIDSDFIIAHWWYILRDGSHYVHKQSRPSLRVGEVRKR